MGGFALVIQPDEEEPEAAEVLVDGSVGGRHYRFLLDTGAAKSAILSDDYTATFAAIGQHTSSGVFAGGSEDEVIAPTIEVGPIVRRDFPVTRLAENIPQRRNLIGMDLLKGYRCHFLFDENRVEIDGDDLPGASFYDLALDSRFHPYVPLCFGAVTASTVWDTGAGITVADCGFVARHPTLFQPADPSEGTDATGDGGRSGYASSSGKSEGCRSAWRRRCSRLRTACTLSAGVGSCSGGVPASSSMTLRPTANRNHMFHSEHMV